MAKWLTVDMVQSRPMDTGADQLERPTCSFNAIITKVPSATFEEEVISVLESAGVGTYEDDIFGTSGAQVPAVGGPFLSVICHGGPSPLNTHDVAGVAYERASAQVFVRGETPVAVRAMAWAAFNALAQIHNQEIAA